jgi:hypothetical protein
MRHRGMTRLAVGCAAWTLALAGLAACDPSGRCPPGRICLFEDNGMRGPMVLLGARDRSYAGDTWWGPDRRSPNDRASSVVNNTDRWVVLHVRTRHRGHAICLGPQRFASNLEAFSYDIFGHHFGDALSSHRTRRSEPRRVAQGGPCDHKL